MTYWIKNEWIMSDDGEWVQDRLAHCLINHRMHIQSMMEHTRITRREYDWFISDDLVIGIPRDLSPHAFYLHVYSKEVR